MKKILLFTLIIFLSTAAYSADKYIVRIDTANMVLIAAGEFLMGSDPGKPEEKPVHKVYLDAYWIDKYEVTFNKYDKFCEVTGRKKPSDERWGRDNRPVINVSWDDAAAYSKWVGKRLPTEAEWEKACRAGSTGEYCFGNNKSKLSDYAWYFYSEEKTQPVGTKKPNSWEIYDMHGNVWEWCADWYNENYYKNSPYKNPTGPNRGECRVVRGGYYGHPAEFVCRSACRYGINKPDRKRENIGFRCAADVVKKENRILKTR